MRSLGCTNKVQHSSASTCSPEKTPSGEADDPRLLSKCLCKSKFQKSHTCWKLLTEIQTKHRTSGGAPKGGYAILKYFKYSEHVILSPS